MSIPSKKNAGGFPIKGITVIIGLICIVLLFFLPDIITRRQLYVAINSSVKNNVISVSQYIESYILEGETSSRLTIKLSRDFENLSVKEKYLELQKVMKKFEIERDTAIYESNLNLKNINLSVLPKVYATTNENEYIYESYDYLKINKTIYSPDDFEQEDKKENVSPSGDFEMSWDTYDNEYNSLGGILTIRREGSKYTQTLVMSDGSRSTTVLTVISDNGEVRLTDRPGNPFGDYMFISSTGYLYFCDSQGVIYSVPPLK